MRRRYKLLAVLIAFPALLALVAAIVLPILADSMHYKRQVIALVKEHTGHELRIDGKVRLHLLPRLRLTVTDMRLANPPGFSDSDLARLPWLAVDVKALPLLAGRIETGAIVVSGLTLNLERDQDGHGNWQSRTAVGTDGAGQQSTAADTPLAAMAVDALDMRDATLHWRDTVSEETITVSAISLQTGALHGGAGIDDVRLQLGLPGGDASLEARGDVMLSAAGHGLVIPELTAALRRVDIAGMPIDGTLTTRLTADFAAQRLTLETLRLSARGPGSGDARLAVAITTELGVDLARQRLSQNAFSVNVPAYSLSGITGDAQLQGVLSGDLQAGTYALESLEGSATMGGEAMAGSSAAFALRGSLIADLEKQTFASSELAIAGGVDGDRVPFRLNANLDLSPRARTLTATDVRLSIHDWRLDGDLTVRAPASPPGVQGVLDLRIQDQPLAGSFGVTESETKAGGIDVRFDLVADLDIEDAGYALRGRHAVLLQATLNRGTANGSWHVGDLRLGARLTDAAYPDGELTINMQADLEVNIDDETVRSDNLRVTVDDSRIVGSVSVHHFDKPAVRVDLQADRIDADRYLLPVAANTDDTSGTKPLGASIEAIRALDFAGEVRVQKLTFKGIGMEDVRLTSGAGADGG